MTPGYSPVSDYISTLGEIGAPYALIQQINFWVLGVSVISLSFGFHRFIRGHGRPDIGTFLLALLVLGVILAGVFPQNSADPMSTTNIFHEGAAIGGFITGIIGISLINHQLDQDKRWQRHRFSTSATLILLLVPFFGVALSPESYVGLTQRLFVGAWTTWVVYHSFRLYKMTV